MSDALAGTLAGIVGAAHVHVGQGLERWTSDWRGRWRGRARAVVLPTSTAEVAAVVRACAQAGCPIVPQGGNTGLVGGGVPDASGTQVVLATTRMARIREVDQANFTMTVEAGCVLRKAQEQAAAHGLLYPLSLAAEGSATIGGTLATNAGGTQVLRYGNARSLCLGLEVVGADGTVWHGLSGLRKDNTGYDLRNLLIGSEGTLGIITAATLALFPQPTSTTTALARCATLAQAVELLARARGRLGASLTTFEIMGDVAIGLVARHLPSLPVPWPDAAWTVLLEVADADAEASARARFESFAAEALQAAAAEDMVVAANLAQAKAMWQLRESIPLAQAREGLNLKHDIALPISQVAAFVADCGQALAAGWPGARVVVFGHLGDGNLHYNLQAPAGVDAADFLARQEAAVNRVVYDRVAARAGTVSAEHGIGALKVAELARYEDATALDWMRRVKAALDPQGTLNPGRVLG